MHSPTWDADSLPLYLLTPRCRVLLQQLTGLQLVKKFPAFHGTPRFITALTSVRHLSLSWASPIQSIYPHPTSWRSILILSTHLCLGLPSGSFPPASPPRPYTSPLLTRTRHMPSPSHSSRFYHPHNVWWSPYLKITLFKARDYYSQANPQTGDLISSRLSGLSLNAFSATFHLPSPVLLRGVMFKRAEGKLRAVWSWYTFISGPPVWNGILTCWEMCSDTLHFRRKLILLCYLKLYSIYRFARVCLYAR